MNNLDRGPVIDVFFQVSVHFGQSVAEKKIILKLTSQKQELNKAAMLGNASGRYEQAKWFQKRN